MRLLLLLILFNGGWAHAASPLAVETREFKGSTERLEEVAAGQIKMPWIVARDKNVATKINDRLFIGQFGVLAPKLTRKYFTAEDGVVVEGLASQDFSISRNDDRVLTVAFENEGCGAYCESYRVFYSFDVKTGDTLAAEDLFTQTGLINLHKQLHYARLSAYRKAVASLRNELKLAQKQRHANDRESLNDLQERIELNSSCAGEGTHTDRTPRAAEIVAVAGFGYDKFELAATEFRLTRERCSNHGMRALDEVGDYTLTLSYPALRPHLSSYGKTLLLNEGSAKLQASIYGQILRGNIGGSEITMLIVKGSDNSVAGHYFYEKYRKPIEVNGRVAGDQLELTEAVAESSAEKSTLRLAISGSRLSGIWKGKKELNVNLTR